MPSRFSKTPYASDKLYKLQRISVARIAMNATVIMTCENLCMLLMSKIYRSTICMDGFEVAAFG